PPSPVFLLGPTGQDERPLNGGVGFHRPLRPVKVSTAHGGATALRGGAAPRRAATTTQRRRAGRRARWPPAPAKPRSRGGLLVFERRAHLPRRLESHRTPTSRDAAAADAATGSSWKPVRPTGLFLWPLRSLVPVEQGDEAPCMAEHLGTVVTDVGGLDVPPLALPALGLGNFLGQAEGILGAGQPVRALLFRLRAAVQL